MNNLKAFLLLSLLSGISSVSHSCTVCFGGPNSSFTKGFFWGIVTLLLLPFVIAAFFILMIVRSSKKNKVKI